MVGQDMVSSFTPLLPQCSGTTKVRMFLKYEFVALVELGPIVQNRMSHQCCVVREMDFAVGFERISLTQ